MLTEVVFLSIYLYKGITHMYSWTRLLLSSRQKVTPFTWLAAENLSELLVCKRSGVCPINMDLSEGGVICDTHTVNSALPLDGAAYVEEGIETISLTVNTSLNLLIANSLQNNDQNESNEIVSGQDRLGAIESHRTTNNGSSSELDSHSVTQFSPGSMLVESTGGYAAAAESCTTKDPQSKPPKPLNVLVYCGGKDSIRRFEGVKCVLESCINTLNYTIYQLKHDDVKNCAWIDTTALLVITSEGLHEGVDSIFLDFFKRGGRVFSCGSSIESRVVKLKARVNSSTNLSRIVTSAGCPASEMTVIGSGYCYHSEQPAESDFKVESLVKEKSTDLPVILKVMTTDPFSSGLMILCQVYLERDPSELAAVGEVYRELKASNSARITLLAGLLRLLGLDCEIQACPAYTPAYLFAVSHSLKAAFLQVIAPRLKQGVLRSDTKSLKFSETRADDDLDISVDLTPVFTNTDTYTPSLFRPRRYFENLTTKILGNIVLYSDVVPTTMNMLDGLKFSVPRDMGLLAVAGRQTAGKGRGGNAWLSPVGCAMFSLHVRFDVHSELGQKAPYVQHIAALAVVMAVRSLPGYQDMDVRIKWPNDVYFGDSCKLGGVLVNTTVLGGVFHCIIGVGVNVTNSNPTVCINDIIDLYNRDHNTRLATISLEQFIAAAVTQIELAVEDFQQNGRRGFCELYYKYWLHSGAFVNLESYRGETVTIRGLDDFGYLEVETKEGERMSIQPDGNSFDMMKNLITIKR